MSLIRASLPSYHAAFMLEDFSLGTTGTTVTATSTVSSGSLAESNLLSPSLDSAWRSGSLIARRDAGFTTMSLIFNLGRARAIDWVSLHRHNNRCPWKIALYRGQPSISSPVYVSEWIDPIVRAELDDYTYLNLRYLLGPTTEDLDLWTDTYRLDSFIAADEVYYAVRYVQIIFDITEEAAIYQPTDYIQVGKPMIGRIMRPKINILRPWELGYQDRSEIIRAESGALLGRSRRGGKTMAFTLSFLEDKEAFEDIFAGFMRRLGALGRIFIWLEPEKRRYFYEQSMVCTATTLPRIAMAAHNTPSAQGWVLEETE